MDGKTATTHHESSTNGSRRAGGLTSGIDLALRVVERYLGNAGATSTARYLEYERAGLSARVAT